MEACFRSGRRPALSEAESNEPKGDGNRLAGVFIMIMARKFPWLGWVDENSLRALRPLNREVSFRLSSFSCITVSSSCFG